MDDSLFISVFIPVYNGENYLRETLLSIQNQSYTYFEVLMVDDSSTDSSLQILNEFAKVDSRFKVFTKENGGMVANSMNFIRPKIRGDYFFYASQDDLFSSDLFEKMVQRQIETDADSILPDMEVFYEKQINNKQIIGLNGNRKVELSGKLACEKSLTWKIHGFALFRSRLVKAEFFPEDAFDSDEYVTRKLFLNSNKVVFSEGVFYYRQDNPNAITKTFGKKNFYILNSSWKLYLLIKQNTFSDAVIFSQQIGILQQYADIYSTFRNCRFEVASEKVDVEIFLADFKKKHLTNSFLFHNFRFIILNLKWKYILWVIIYETSFLFRLVINYKARFKGNLIRVS
jgi:glycosyltransferase involved in cell wall biosynthesis